MTEAVKTTNEPGVEDVETSEPDAPGVPAEDPKPEFYVIQSTAELYLRNLNILTQNSVIGSETNKHDKQQYVLAAMQVAKDLTIIDLQRAQLGRADA